MPVALRFTPWRRQIHSLKCWSPPTGLQIRLMDLCLPAPRQMWSKVVKAAVGGRVVYATVRWIGEKNLYAALGALPSGLMLKMCGSSLNAWRKRLLRQTS